jgi:type 1 glutamine amidotransferase
MNNKRALILLGGMWHDFDGFARTATSLLATAGWQTHATYDLDHLTRLETDTFDLVVSYTCFSIHAEGLDNSGPEQMSDAQIDGLTRWVQAGGGFLSMHSASVCGLSGPGLRELTGGRFVSHPDPFVFTVYPVHRPHPIIANVEAFSVYDEMYIEECDPNVDIHMWTIDRGIAYPMVWSKPEGHGRVAHIAMGHYPAVWAHEQYQRLMLQTITWLTEKM